MITATLRTRTGILLRKLARIGTERFVRLDLGRGEVPLKSLRTCISPEEANRVVGESLRSGKPFMVGRLGMFELSAVTRYRKMKTLSAVEKLADYGRTGEWDFGWTRGSFRELECNAGFFPVSKANLDRFAELMIDSMGKVDLLGSWVPSEGLFSSELSNAAICGLGDLEPYHHDDPWSHYLAGRKVLVIHPFADSIQRQYKLNRRLLFEDPRVLPEFELTTLPAVQSIAGNRPAGYSDWFAALDDTYNKAISADPDVVILGCGAYGFPLAAMLKSAGKQAIHLGGCTQILFGIKGRRWDRMPTVSRFYNEHWVRPSPEERPPGAEKVEGGCYW